MDNQRYRTQYSTSVHNNQSPFILRQKRAFNLQLSLVFVPLMSDWIMSTDRSNTAQRNEVKFPLKIYSPNDLRLWICFLWFFTLPFGIFFFTFHSTCKLDLFLGNTYMNVRWRLWHHPPQISEYVIFISNISDMNSNHSPQTTEYFPRFLQILPRWKEDFL